ncbi:MAG TPA: ATP-binding protein [Aestuariivirga sp.]
MSLDGEEVKYATQLARQSLLKIGIFAALLLALLVAERIHFQTAIIGASARLAHAEEIKGNILLADEKLTMSAYAYANSGDVAMHKRYLDAIPEIDTAIADAKKLAPPEAAVRFDDETRVANDELVKMEMKSFELVAQHRMGEAARIFSSQAYLENKKILADGSDRFIAALDSELATASARVRWTRLFLLAAISALGVVGFLAIWKRLNEALFKSEKSFLAADAKIRSELAVAHEEILRKTRMAQLGNLTATVAHELRNPLSGVRTAAFLVKKRLAEHNFNVAVPLERIDKSVARCDNVISQLLDFSRTSPAQKMEIDLDNWLAETVKETAQNLPPMVEVECSLGLDGRKLNFDPDRMQRVVINLISNASEAMVGRGDTPAETNGKVPRIYIQSKMSPRGAELIVVDNGPGISPENLKKILEPLFTTKNFGTGLGLPAVQNILLQHGGGLDIASKKGEGATFTAWFPAEISPPEFKDAA